ncbi:MAG: beta-hydroxyacyl-ACP dehydratase [Bacteroidales bacterium]|nr:beta-hydroxyacyl-ACP dehydratase [Bacteroidales bacterium]
MDNYFFIVEQSLLKDGFPLLKVELNKECAVYQGHFPGNPISPGVCNLRMIQKCAEIVIGRPLSITRINYCRFLKLITPLTHHFLFVKIQCTRTDEGYSILSSILDENDTVLVDFKGVLIEKDI